MTHVSRETRDKLEAFAALLIAENERQNLVSRSTIDDLWDRHIVDGLQLLDLASEAGTWVDIGSGAGLPGIVLAIASEADFTLVEPRRLRAEFLSRAVGDLALSDRVTIIQAKVEAVRARRFDVITARAVASIEKLFAMANHLSHDDTIWVLPKGRSVNEELAEARRTWQGSFRLVPSRTDAEAQILVAAGVSRIGGARGMK